MPAASVPTAGVDPRASLAATLQSAGTTAVLLGSGVSSAAGIPTGWQITQDLIRRVAVGERVPLELVSDSPEDWWKASGRGEPRYDTVLTALARTDPDRQTLLRRYFEPDPADRTPPQPTEAHRALARLARRGSVPVIVTTNFDRLLERALDAEGVVAQVLIDASAVAGMTPLVHADVTVIKLHGDYAGGRLRNSPEELENYPPGWRMLLKRVFNEFGLLIVGWSGEHDLALTRAVNAGVGRRYAWYWAAHNGELTEEARRLVNGRHAHVISTTGADELLLDLEGRIAALDQIAVRRQVPQRTNYRYSVDARPPQGWTGMPLVVARTVAAFWPAPLDSVGQIDPVTREQLIRGLETSALSTLLRRIATDRKPFQAGADATGHPGSVQVMGSWEAPQATAPNAGRTPSVVYQSTTRAVYRMGSDGSEGVSALVTVDMPGQTTGAQVVITGDVGMSLQEGVSLALLGTVLRDTLLTLVNQVTGALENVMPRAVELQHVEVHWTAPENVDGFNRPVPPGLGLDFTPLGTASRPQSPYGGYAEGSGLLVSHDTAGEFILRAFTTVALDTGFLDPRRGLETVADQLHSPEAGGA